MMRNKAAISSSAETGCQMVFKKFSDLESHLDLGEHREERRGSENGQTLNKRVGQLEFDNMLWTHFFDSSQFTLNFPQRERRPP